MCEWTSTSPVDVRPGDADAMAEVKVERATPEIVAALRVPSSVLRSITVEVLVSMPPTQLTLSSHMR
jgi:HEAT repeat protein